MNRLFIAAIALASATALSARPDELITLNLAEATTALEFETTNGAWTETMSEQPTEIVSQVFRFSHHAMPEWLTWWGFTASNSTDNSRPQSSVTDQYSAMAGGGVTTGTPYIIGYYAPFFGAKDAEVRFVDDQSYTAVSCMVNLTTLPYYAVTEGNDFARAFGQDDRLVLTIHGVGADGSEKTIDVTMADGTETNRQWLAVDLSTLGEVKSIYFTMSTTDVGEWGDNTPEYFALDALTVRTDNSSIVLPAAASGREETFDLAGRRVSGSTTRGICIKRCADGTIIKFRAQ